MAEDHEKDQSEMTEDVVVPGGLHPPKVVKKPREQLASSPTEWQPTSGPSASVVALLSVIATLLLVGVVVVIVWVTRPGPEIVDRERQQPPIGDVKPAAQAEPTETERKTEAEAGPEPEREPEIKPEPEPEPQPKPEPEPQPQPEKEPEAEPEAEPETNLTAVLVTLSPSALTSDADATLVRNQLRTVLQKLRDSNSPMSSDDRRRIHSWLRTIPMESVNDTQVKQTLFDIRAWSWYGADDSASLDRSEASDRGFSDTVSVQVGSADSLRRLVHEFTVGLVIARTSSGPLLLGTYLTAEPPAASTTPPSSLSQAEQEEWDYCHKMIEGAEDDLARSVYHYRLANLCLQAAGRVPPIDSETFEMLIEKGLEHFTKFEQYSSSIPAAKGASLLPTAEVQEFRSKLLLAHRVVLAQKAAQGDRPLSSEHVQRIQQIADQVVGDFAREGADAKITLTSSDTALLHSLKGRIEALDQELDEVRLLMGRVEDLIARGPEMSLGGFVSRSSEITKLLQDVHQLEREQISPTPVLTRGQLVQFLERVRLPSRLEELNPATPPTVAMPPDSQARLVELWQGMRDDVGSMQATIAELSGDTASVPVEQVPEVRSQMDRILYAAVQLETVRLLPVSVGPPVLPPGGHVQKYSPADFWRDMYQVTEQLRRLEEQVAQASEGQRENTDLVAAVRTELQQLRAVQTDEQDQIQAAQQRLADLQRTMGDVATRLETTVSQQVAEHQRRSSQAQQELKNALTAQIDQALLQPRALPPDQHQKMRDEVVERLLTEMATYGYTPPADSADSQTAPRVEPLAEQPNPMWAEELYGRGYTAYFGSRFDQSIGYFSQAIRNDPRNPVYHYFLGLSLYQSGRMEEATAQVKAARRLESSNGSRQVNSALHRVQGPARIWLEEVRLRS